MWGRDAYARWAPEQGPWSLWAKPTLFAQVTGNVETLDAPAFGTKLPTAPPPGGWDGAAKPNVPGSPLELFVASMAPTGQPAFTSVREDQLVHMPPADGKTLIISELPGLNSVELALMLARRGWRPVPLFNGTHDSNAEIKQGDLIKAMTAATDELGRIDIPLEAPPVFLLDAGRRGRRSSPPPGTFDNRWIVFPQDFPSGNLLLSRGYENALIVMNNGITLADDLTHVLRRWQEAGMTISHDNIDTSSPPQVFDVPTPSRFRNLFYRVLAAMGMHRNSAGGFGSRVPVPSQGGGG